jgi:NAD(P)-dependent dehydrogenase (short-subunit alcohol dehydrogenase family)
VTRALLITGASSGIGRATALLASSAGYDVAVHFRTNGAEALRVVEALRRDGRRAIAREVAADGIRPFRCDRAWWTPR